MADFAFVISSIHEDVICVEVPELLLLLCAGRLILPEKKRYVTNNHCWYVEDTGDNPTEVVKL